MRSNIELSRTASHLLVAFLTVTASLSAALPAVAADYPSRPLRLLVPFPPGGGVDLLARLLGSRLGEALGQQVVVDNRAGGGGVIATDTAAKAPADGYTMLLGFIGPLAISPTISKLPYDPVRDFAALDPLASSYHIVVINPSLPARSVKEFIALAKSQPGKLNYASSGSGTNLHLAGELFKMVVGVNIVHVPYKGAGPAASAVLAGESQLFFGSITSSMPFVRANRLVALAVTSPARSPLAPEIPTLDRKRCRRRQRSVLVHIGRPGPDTTRCGGPAALGTEEELRRTRISASSSRVRPSRPATWRPTSSPAFSRRSSTSGARWCAPSASSPSRTFDQKRTLSRWPGPVGTAGVFPILPLAHSGN